jgi:hypothetical protein
VARDAVAMMLSSGSLTLQAHEFVAGVGHREIDSREVFAWIQIRDHIKVGCRRTMARPATSRSVFFFSSSRIRSTVEGRCVCGPLRWIRSEVFVRKVALRSQLMIKAIERH